MGEASNKRMDEEGKGVRGEEKKMMGKCNVHGFLNALMQSSKYGALGNNPMRRLYKLSYLL